MIEIDLIRHVKVVGKPALYGCTDIAPIASENAGLLNRLLTQQQTNQAYQAVVCSPLSRCHTVAKQFASLCQLPLALSSDLQEMNFGCFDGVPFDDLVFDDLSADKQTFEENTVKENVFKKSTFKDTFTENKLPWSQLEAFFHAPAEIVLPGAETLSDFHQRVILAWNQLIAQQVAMVAKQKVTRVQAQESVQQNTLKPRRLLLIAHGGVIRMILAHILQLNWQQASWHQKLQLAHGSLSRVLISQPYQASHHDHQNFNQQFHQQVTSIAMPFLEGIQ